ncbi:MAG: P-loop NTPase [Planctomycetes bacterium]|nr:P-loop NTPase [Planctomycetota bacterium]
MDEKKDSQGTRPGAQEKAADEARLKERISRIGKKILVLSGKGGVGKSTVAANLALSLAAAGKKVGLLDVDIHGPSIPVIMGLVGTRLDAVEGGIVPAKVGANLKVMSIGFLLQGEDDAVIWRGPLKYNAIKQFISEVEWGEIDYLIVDSPPGTGDEPLSVAQLLGEAQGAVIVTTPQRLAISDVRRCISFCRKLALPVIGVIENMSGFVCPFCGKRIDIFKSGGGEEMAGSMGVAFLGRVPIDVDIVEAGDAGTPYVEAFSESPAAQSFAGIVEGILRQVGDSEGNQSVASSRKGETTVKLAIPLADGSLSMHFGHAQEFALVEVDREKSEVLSMVTLSAPPHEPGLLPRYLHENGANVIIASGMGQRAQGLFSENGIEVVTGVAAGSPEEIAQQYLSGSLAAGDNICDH